MEQKQKEILTSGKVGGKRNKKWSGKQEKWKVK